MFPRPIENDAFYKTFEKQFKPSNEILPVEEQEIVHTLIADSQRILDSLNNEIVAQKVPLQPLFDHRKNEMLRMERLHTGVAPHKTIPAEILLKIFIHTLDDRITHVRLKRQECPWNLIQVCSLWRAVALAETQLWDTMMLVASPDIASSSSLADTDTIHVQPRQVPQFLEHLTIGVIGDLVDLGFVLAPFSQCKKLRTVEFLEGSPVDFLLYHSGLTNGFPWAQLTNLVIPDDGIDPLAFIMVLRQSINLIKVGVTLQVRYTEWEHIESVTVPHLLFLELNSRSSVLINQFLKFLTLPSLETVSLGTTNSAFKRPWSSLEIIRLVNRSGCSVKHFFMRNLEIPSEEVLLFLPAVPELKSLDIDDFVPVSELMLESMRERDLVPKLEMLSVRVGSFRACQRLLEARYQGIPSTGNRKMLVVNVTASLLDCRDELDDCGSYDIGSRVRGEYYNRTYGS